MSEYQEQYDLEKWWIETHRAKEVEYVDLLRESGRAGSDRGVKSLLIALSERLSVVIEQVSVRPSNRKFVATRRSAIILSKLLKSINAYELAYLVLHTAAGQICSESKPVTATRLATVLASAVQAEIQYRAMLKLEPALQDEVNKILSKSAATAKHYQRVFVTMFGRKLNAKIPKVFTDPDTFTEVGNTLLELLLTDIGAKLVRIETIRSSVKRVQLLAFPSEALLKLLEREGELEWLGSLINPFGITVFQPQDRRLNEGKAKECILTREVPVLKVNPYVGKNPFHLEKIINEDQGYTELLTSISELERVPYKINRPMLDWVQANLHELRQRGILTDLNLEIPDSPLQKDARKEDLSEADREKFDLWRRYAATIHNKKYKARLKLIRENLTLKLADRLSQYPKIYYRWYSDFRGRLYPMNSDLSIQGGPLAKSLLEFATPGWMVVGSLDDIGWSEFVEYGLRLLPVYEKATIEELKPLFTDRVLLNGFELGLSVLKDYTKTKNILPLASWILELQRVLPKWGSSVTTGHPIRRDATCSSMQHMGGLCGDLAVLEYTNARTVENPTVRDLYSELVPDYRELGLTRDDVKSFIMTYAYNSTDYSRKSIIKLNHPKTDYQEISVLNERLKDAASKGLGKVIVLQGLLMQALSFIGRGNFGERPATSYTGIGLVVDSTKYDFPTKRYSLYSINSTIKKRLQIAYKRTNEDDIVDAPINRRKTAQAWVANIVHSMDANLLHMTLNNFSKRKGINERPHFGTVHDCVVTRVGDMGNVTRGLQSVFAAMYGPMEEGGVSRALSVLLKYWDLEEENPELYAAFLELKACPQETFNDLPYLFV